METKKNKAFLANHNKHFEALRSLNNYRDLRRTLHEELGLHENISFRHNTTSCIISLLQSMQSSLEDDYYLVFSNLEHPCIRKVIHAIWNKERIIDLNLFPYLLDGDLNKIEEELARPRTVKCVYVISHVLWNTGLRIDIDTISKEIKKFNLDSIIVIDGAQAVGNLNPPILEHTIMDLVDFYVGCTHKWIGTSNTLGFVSIHPKLISTSLFIQIMLSDMFSSFAGVISIKEKMDVSTYNLILLLSITKELDKIFSDGITTGLVFSLNEINKGWSFNRIFCEKNRRTCFSSVSGPKKTIKEFCLVNNIDSSFMIADEFLPKEECWLRIGMI